MAKPAISGLPQNIIISAAALLVDGVDVGLVSGVKLTIKELTSPVMTDQLGKMKVNDFYVGHEAMGELTFDEFTAAKMKIAFPQAQLLTSGGVSRLSFGKQIGTDYLSLAQKFEFIPTSDDVNYAGRHFVFWKMVFMGEASIDYGPDKKLVFKAKMQAYPDPVGQPSGLWLGYFGDSAAGTLVPSAAAAAVPGVGNVGNGTVSNESTNDAFTKTETWTLTAITSTVFSVVGAVTGARGTATVGSTYSSNSVTPANSELILKINAGGTAFAAGDSFTIATTAANYV